MNSTVCDNVPYRILPLEHMCTCLVHLVRPAISSMILLTSLKNGINGAYIRYDKPHPLLQLIK